MIKGKAREIINVKVTLNEKYLPCTTGVDMLCKVKMLMYGRYRAVCGY